MSDMQIDLRVIRVKESLRGYSIKYSSEIIRTRNGWKNISTNNVVWDDEEVIELITDEQKAREK